MYKLLFYCLGFFLPAFFSCQKNPQNVALPPPAAEEFTQYFIPAGKHEATTNLNKPLNLTELNFKVKFDNSAIYTTQDPVNQLDINKLYGFADNNQHHSQFSARFGWRWSDNALRLFGYVYNNGVRSSKELGTVSIGAENSCSLKITPSAYYFMLNGKLDSLSRQSTTATAVGYQLYPYFGGDEVAPHDVRIWIKELK